MREAREGRHPQDILLAGSADLLNSLIPRGLIDEYRLLVHPVVVGSGKHLFREGSNRALGDYGEVSSQLEAIRAAAPA
jgi:Dihydrofolate reductase